MLGWIRCCHLPQAFDSPGILHVPSEKSRNFYTSLTIFLIERHTAFTSGASYEVEMKVKLELLRANRLSSAPMWVWADGAAKPRE
jgi:hypothetical protein